MNIPNSILYLIIIGVVVVSMILESGVDNKRERFFYNLFILGVSGCIVLKSQGMFILSITCMVVYEVFINDKKAKNYYIKIILSTLIVLIAEIIYKYRVWFSDPIQIPFYNETDFIISKILYIILCTICLYYTRKELPFKNKNLIYLLLVLNLIIAI